MGKTYPRKSTKVMQYHSRRGYPTLHLAKTSNRKYIMVRHPSGRGTKRLYLNRQGNVPVQHRT